MLTSSSAGAGGPTVERSRCSVSVPSAAFSRSPCGRAVARHQSVWHGCDAAVIWRMPLVPISDAANRHPDAANRELQKQPPELAAT